VIIALSLISVGPIKNAKIVGKTKFKGHRFERVNNERVFLPGQTAGLFLFLRVVADCSVSELGVLYFTLNLQYCRWVALRLIKRHEHGVFEHMKLGAGLKTLVDVELAGLKTAAHQIYRKVVSILMANREIP
jgi:hypothetical protein